jgi:hypothetical protein
LGWWAATGKQRWWARQDSNLQPDGYEPSALTIELQARRASVLANNSARATLENEWPARTALPGNAPHVKLSVAAALSTPSNFSAGRQKCAYACSNSHNAQGARDAIDWLRILRGVEQRGAPEAGVMMPAGLEMVRHD